MTAAQRADMLNPPHGARLTRADYAARIGAAWRSSVTSIIETGQLLIAAKAALDHGEFGEMVERDLPFTTTTAERLMIVARNPNIINPAHAQLLPHPGTASIN